MEASIWFLKKYKKGEVPYYMPRQRGCVEVYHNSERWIYRFEPNRRKREYKQALQRAFADYGKLKGSWPDYYI